MKNVRSFRIPNSPRSLPHSFQCSSKSSNDTYSSPIDRFCIKRKPNENIGQDFDHSLPTQSASIKTGCSRDDAAGGSHSAIGDHEIKTNIEINVVESSCEGSVTKQAGGGSSVCKNISEEATPRQSAYKEPNAPNANKKVCVC